MSWIIKDWAGNLMNPYAMVKAYKAPKEAVPTAKFDSFDDAEYFLDIVLGDQYEEERQEYEIDEVEVVT